MQPTGEGDVGKGESFFRGSHYHLAGKGIRDQGDRSGERKGNQGRWMWGETPAPPARTAENHSWAEEPVVLDSLS